MRLTKEERAAAIAAAKEYPPKRAYQWMANGKL